jgi:hypothetical protein
MEKKPLSPKNDFIFHKIFAEGHPVLELSKMRNTDELAD